MTLRDFVFGPLEMEDVRPKRAREAAIRAEMQEHPVQDRRDFPADEVKPTDINEWRARQSEYARREAVLRACWRF